MWWGRVNASEEGGLLMGEVRGKRGNLRLWGDVLLRQMHGGAIPGKEREGIVDY